MLQSELFIQLVTNLLLFFFHILLYLCPSTVICHWIGGQFIFLVFISYSHWATQKKMRGKDRASII